MREYKAGIYLRLSHEDIQENNSIEAQRMITTEYAIKHKYNIIEEYVDNGYSGMIDSRPGLNRMIVDITTNKINMVIVKDISRLTRNKNKTGYYTEIFFPDNDIRFISVTEMIDSGERYEIDDSIMLRGIVNQFYVADISRKIKSVKTNKKKNGEYVEHFVPYGYKKDTEDKYKVLVDENVSKNVKLMFKMYLQGYSQGQIAKHLTLLGLDTPKKYKGHPVKINEWRNDTVGRILKDPFYTGQMIINKKVSDYRTKKIKNTPRENWILIQGKHEPLVSMEDYEKVQQMLKEKFNAPKQKYEYLLKGLVYCGHCKSQLQYKCRTRTKIRDKYLKEPQECWYYKCRMLYRFPSICNRGHTIQEKNLNTIVLESLKKRLSKFKIDKYTGEVIDTYKKNDSNYKLLEQYTKRSKKLETDVTALYNKKLEGMISIDSFREEYAKLKLEIKEIENKKSQLEEICETKEIKGKLKNIIVDFKNGKEFTNETIKQLIERIEVYEDMKIDIIYKV